MAACPPCCLLTLPFRNPQGGLPSLSPTCPAFSFVSCPHPPAPLPLRGRGRILLYFAGGFAPGTPALDRLRHVQLLPSRCPLGGLPGWLPADLAAVVSAGGLALLVACLPCLSLCFLPPSPLPPFPSGRGRILLYFAGGFAPGTPALNRLRHLQLLPSRCPVGRLARLVAG